MSIIIRHAQEDDAAAMCAFLDALRAEKLDTVGQQPPYTEEQEREFIRNFAQNGRAFFLLALDGGRVIGLLDLVAGLRPVNRHTAKFGMSVLGPWRRKGVGRRLLQAALAEAKAWDGFCRVELEVAAHNLPAIRLYESLGFVHEGRRAKAINVRGMPEDSLAMAKVW